MYVIDIIPLLNIIELDPHLRNYTSRLWTNKYIINLVIERYASYHFIHKRNDNYEYFEFLRQVCKEIDLVYNESYGEKLTHGDYEGIVLLCVSVAKYYDTLYGNLIGNRGGYREFTFYRWIDDTAFTILKQPSLKNAA